MIVKTIPPWSTINATFNYKLETETSKKDTKEQQRQDADLTLSGLKQADMVIWTDGSVAESNDNSGSGILIQDIENQQDDMKVSLPAEKISPSYRTEAVDILSALKIIEEWNLHNTTETRICTGSQSTVRKLKGGPRIAYHR